MNNSFITQKNFSAKFFALGVITSMIFSAFLGAFLNANVAEAAASGLTMEVFANPVGNDTDLEYISVTNNGPDSFPLGGFKFDEGGVQLPTIGGFVATGVTFSICANDDYATNGGRACYLEFPAGFDLVNTGGTVKFLDAADAEVLVATWGDVSGSESAAASVSVSGTYPIVQLETIKVCKFLADTTTGLPDWGMIIGNGEDTYNLTTGADGCVSQEVDTAVGPWWVNEVQQLGWAPASVRAPGGTTGFDEGGMYCKFFGEEEVNPSDENICEFYNRDERPTFHLDGFKYESFRDGTPPPKEGWTIYAVMLDKDGIRIPETVVETTTAADGSYYFDVTDRAAWVVYEEERAGWVQEEVSQNGVVVTDSTGLESCYFEVGSTEDGPDDVEQYQCDFINYFDDSTEPEVTYRLDGYKYQTEGEVRSPKAGWTIYASNGVDEPLRTFTDANGYFFFDVEEGTWAVTEEEREDWSLVWLEQGGYARKFSLELPGTLACVFNLGEANNDEDGPQYAQLISEEVTSPYHCEFTNEYTEPETSRKSSGGTLIDRYKLAPAPTGEVLGASTADFCPFLTSPMQMGTQNDSMEVMKLQAFLNIFRDTFGGTENPVTGFFGSTTDANVRAFQEHYRTEILEPWFNLGIVPHNRPTGFVYKTTMWKINSIVCGDSTEGPNLEGEDLNSNVAIN